jgi:hypothetical protein
VRKEDEVPEKETLRRAQRDKQQGKAASTQAGEFVREEIDHIREGKHGARSAKQAIAIGLSKARRAGVKLPPPKPGARTREQAARDSRRAHSTTAAKPSPKRSAAALRALKKEGRAAGSHRALSTQARRAHTRSTSRPSR